MHTTLAAKPYYQKRKSNSDSDFITIVSCMYILSGILAIMLVLNI